jgi:hypothetical protein
MGMVASLRTVRGPIVPELQFDMSVAGHGAPAA